MDQPNVWSVLAKDLNVFKKKKNILFSIILFPLAIAIGQPVLILLLYSEGSIIPSAVFTLIIVPLFSFFFTVPASLVPIPIAGYSLVGEKLDKSLEPLLVTPLTDNEILFGKILAAFLPTLVAMYISIILFMVLMDAVTIGSLGYYLYPNWTMGIIMFFVIPLAIIFSVEGNIIISSRVTDVRTSSQFGLLFVLPFVAITALSETSCLTLDDTTLLLISLVFLLIDISLLVMSRLIFRREEILTKWR